MALLSILPHVKMITALMSPVSSYLYRQHVRLPSVYLEVSVHAAVAFVHITNVLDGTFIVSLKMA